MDEDKKPTPIACEITERDPNVHERPHAGNNRILEARIDFHFWNGDEWIEYGCGETEILTKTVSKNRDLYEKRMEAHCWHWFSDMLKKGEIEHGDPGNTKTSKVLAVSKYQIYFERDENNLSKEELIRRLNEIGRKEKSQLFE